jgi:perosamine synthetase
MKDLSILIPARNEMFIARTIEDILANIEADTEIIVVLDGAWADPPIPQHERVNVIYVPQSIGQRAATNLAAKLSKAKYVMKCDAHCAFDKGFDIKMIDAFKQAGDNVTMVPIMRNLWAFDWKCFHCGWKKYQGPTPEKCGQCGKTDKIRRKMLWIGKNNPQSTSYCFDSTPHFQYFEDWKHRPEYEQDKKDKGLTETMSLQGSCWMLTRDKYWELNVCDETFGSWGSQGIEVAVKTWLSGGQVLVNHKTWYAHMFRTQGGDFGFPYPISVKDQEKAKAYAKDLFFNNKWDKQTRPFSWLVEKFWPVKGWTNDDLVKLKENKFEFRGDSAIKPAESEPTEELSSDSQTSEITPVTHQPTADIAYLSGLTIPVVVEERKQKINGYILEDNNQTDFVDEIEEDIPIITSYKHFMPPESIANVAQTLSSSRIGGDGPRVKEFENEIAKIIQNKNVLAVNSGTSALQLALHLIGVGGGEVVTSPMTCFATTTAIINAGAIPVWADIDPNTGNIDPYDIARKITQKTKAIMVVHWGGSPSEVDLIAKIASIYNLPVIEDAAQALGSEYDGKAIGNHSDFVTFSFQAIKIINTIDGGLLATSKKSTAKRGKILRWYGVDREAKSADKNFNFWDYPISEVGFKMQMTDVNASIGLGQIPYLKEHLKHRRKLAKIYEQALTKSSTIKAQKILPKAKSNYWMFTVICDNPVVKLKLTQDLAKIGVKAEQAHRRNDTYPLFKNKGDNLPGVTYFNDNHLIIPIGHWVDEQKAKEIADVLASSGS